MPQQLIRPDVIVYVCANCVPQSGRLPRQWVHEGMHVLVREVPCSGKMDAQYLMHGLEGGERGLCVVACPKGECHLAQGNYRAEVRVRCVQQLLTEVGLEAGRAELIHCSPQDPPEQLQDMVQAAVGRICAFGESSVQATER